jgi:hypothetical protein
MLMAGDLYHTVDEWAPAGRISEHGIAKPGNGNMEIRRGQHLM